MSNTNENLMMLALAKAMQAQSAAGSAAAAADDADRAEAAAEEAMTGTPEGYSNIVGSIASTFSSSKDYAVGDYVLKDSTLYRFTSAHAAGAWTGSDATEVNLGDETSDLKSANTHINSITIPQITGNEEIPISSGYINTNGSTVDINDVIESDSFFHAVVTCSQGDKFTINGIGAGTARLWAFVQSNGDKISAALSTDTADDLVLTAPENAAYFVYNTRATATNKFCCHGDKLINLVNRIASNSVQKPQINTFTVNADTTHSSSYHRINIPINFGDDYFVLLNTSLPVTMAISEVSGSALESFTFSGIGIHKVTATNNILSIGLFVDNKNDSAVSVSFGVLTNADMSAWTIAEELYKLEYNLPFDDVVENYIRAQNYDSSINNYANVLLECGKSDQFIYFTDPHLLQKESDFQLKFMEYTGVIGRMYDKTSTEFVLCGGDWLIDGTTPTEAIFRLNLMDGRMKELFGERYYPMFGNHDDNIQGVEYDGLKQFSQDMIDNTMFSRFGKSYYSFNSKQATYYVLDSEQDSTPALSMNTHKWEQIDWLANGLKDNDNTNNVICMHILFNYPFTAGDSLTALADNAEKVAEAYNNKTTVTLNDVTYDFADTSGKVRFMLGGHLHSDSSDISNFSLPIITRTTTLEGTTPCYDIVAADWDNLKLNMLRVGGNRANTVDVFDMAD